MDYVSTQTIQSSFSEDISFVLNKMSEGRRISLRLKLAGMTNRLRELMEQANQAVGTENVAQASMLFDQVKEVVDDQITPEWVRWGLVSIHGLRIDGEAATVESMIAKGPRSLYNEIVLAIKAEAGITEEERGESEPPSTSAAPVDGGNSTSSAVDAGSKAST